MDKLTKIKILEAIKSGRLPLEALNLEAGVYRKQENGMYKKGNFEITHEQLLKTCAIMGYSVTEIYFDDKEKPYSVWVSLQLMGGKKRQTINTTITRPQVDRIFWEEILTPKEIELTDEEAAENLSSFFETE